MTSFGGLKLGAESTTDACGAGDVSNDATKFANDIMQTVLEYAADAVDTATEIDVAVDIEEDAKRVLVPAQNTYGINFNKAMDALAALLVRLPDELELIEVDQSTAQPPDLADIPEVDAVEISDFFGVSPTISIPDTPDALSADLPAEPEIVYPAVPTKPNYTQPTEPYLASVELPPVPAVSVPVFDEILVDEELLTPSNTFDFSVELYTSVLKDAVASGLLDEVQNGGYGLDPADEALLWARAREREQVAANQAIEDVMRTFSHSGFSMPPGALQSQIWKAQKEALNKTTSINREQTLERSNKYWEGKKFTYEQAQQLERLNIDLHNATQERSLNAAKATVQVAIDLFNANVTAYTARQERYKILAEVFDTVVRSEIAKVELYKAQVEGANVLVNVNRSQIDLYNARLASIQQIIDTYKTDVDAFNAISQVEKLKIEIFQAQVEAYVAEVEAKESEFKAYESQIRGEVSKVQAYEAEANAYRAVVDGQKAKIEASKLQLESYIETNKANVDIFEARSGVFNNIRQSQIAYNQSAGDGYKARASMFDAEIRGLIGAYGVNTDALQAQHQQQLATLAANTETAKLELSRIIDVARLQQEGRRAEADIARTLAASALSAVNCNASLSDSVSHSLSLAQSCSTNYSESVVDSNSNSNQVSASTSTSTANNTSHQTSSSTSHSTNYTTQTMAGGTKDELTTIEGT
jgi:hypothetical protein